MEQSRLDWTYNAGLHIVARVLTDHEVTSSPINPGPTNPAFISVYVTNFSFDSKMLLANFSSVLTVDLLELNKQNIKNISCGGWSDKDTQQVDTSDFFNFTLNITASYQSGILSRIEVHLVSCLLLYTEALSKPLQQTVCPDHEYNESSLTYDINLNGYNTSQASNCVSASCTIVFMITENPLSMGSEVTIVATFANHSYTSKNLTVGK